MSGTTRLVLVADLPTEQVFATRHNAKLMLGGEDAVESATFLLGDNDALVAINLSAENRRAIARAADAASEQAPEVEPTGRLADAQECREHLLSYIEHLSDAPRSGGGEQ